METPWKIAHIHVRDGTTHTDSEITFEIFWLRQHVFEKYTTMFRLWTRFSRMRERYILSGHLTRYRIRKTVPEEYLGALACPASNERRGYAGSDGL